MEVFEIKPSKNLELPWRIIDWVVATRLTRQVGLLLSQIPTNGSIIVGNDYLIRKKVKM